MSHCEGSPGQVSAMLHYLEFLQVTHNGTGLMGRGSEKLEGW